MSRALSHPLGKFPQAMIRNTLGVGVTKMHDGSQQSARVAARREPRTAVLVSSRELQSLGVTSDPRSLAFQARPGLGGGVCVWRRGRFPQRLPPCLSFCPVSPKFSRTAFCPS